MLYTTILYTSNTVMLGILVRPIVLHTTTTKMLTDLTHITRPHVVHTVHDHILHTVHDHILQRLVKEGRLAPQT